MNKNSERGNAIVWILIAVALFAALNYAFTSSSRVSTSVLSDAEAEAYANEIIQYGNEVKSAVKKMQLLGIKTEEIDFFSELSLQDTLTEVQWPNNPNCTTQACKVFNISGGGLQGKVFEKISIDDAYTSSAIPKEGHPAIFRTKILGVGSDAQDLVLQIWGLQQNVCDAINNLLGKENLGDFNENFGSFGLASDYWDLNNDNFIQVLGDQNPNLVGQLNGCFNQPSHAKNIYFQVLISR